MNERIYTTRTITERIAKRIRRHQQWNRSVVPDATILKWAQQYATIRRQLNEELLKKNQL